MCWEAVRIQKGPSPQTDSSIPTTTMMSRDEESDESDERRNERLGRRPPRRLLALGVERRNWD